ncbi:MAG TPA: UDP-N-acetylmuramoyl-L-alanyl-D-glutamate--2,6-diaminopimelate ligase [Mycobacteriales bacterium]|nr:UDP-N-acetylmuramoyl-L-alanyl-D-glutamate--2,6-diaminopimelate ligase [Mycobacteriales bacterium]
MPDLPIRPSVVTRKPVSDLLERLRRGGLAGARIDGDPTTTVSGITHDSRGVQPNDLYVARAGARTHGIAHLSQAISNGAVAVLTDPASVDAARTAGVAAVVVVDDPRTAMGAAAAWAYDDAAVGMTLLGVTGTNGKTTTAYLVDSGLRAAGLRTGLVGTIETRVVGEVLPSARTTPEATDLHALLAVMKERGVDAVAMEVSSHALALGRVDGVVFDVAGFTNLSQDHLDFHHDMADYFAAKAELFTPSHSRRGVVCVEDEWGLRLTAQAQVPITTTGSAVPGGDRSPHDWRRLDPSPATATEPGSVRLAAADGREVVVGCSLLGGMNLANAALGYLMLVEAGIDPAAARDGVAALRNVPGRLERVDVGQPYLALVDYAHTPRAVTAVLEDARAIAEPGARVLVVLGCGGDRDRDKRPLMGRAAALGADSCVFTNDNPRSEDPAEILDAMQRDLPPGSRVAVQPDRARAIEIAVGQARPGDVLVVAGKGHEQGQETGGVVVPFDDRVVLRDAIAASLGTAS